MTKDAIKVSGPKFVEDLRDLVAKPGQNITFSCKITGQPKPVVKWYKVTRISFLYIVL